MQTIQEFAATKNISKCVVDTWIYRHGLPVIKIGKRNYIDENDYESWQNRHRQTMSQDLPKIQIPIPISIERPKSKIASKMRKIY